MPTVKQLKERLAIILPDAVLAINTEDEVIIYTGLRAPEDGELEDDEYLDEIQK